MQAITRTSLVLALVLPFGSLNLHAAERTLVERYHYGMQLDVQKVLALEEVPSSRCQVVEARMDYLDSQGHERSLAYLKHAKACENEN
ncbi:DUF2790 domain-containing protein [Pseudomonas sp. LMG 31766]|uniref:DUF2790 domain-containing protein n=1 Tax=Pseudomonas chaetocerotis TaxID=2758695 RepID=A0A931D2Y8_9PSED|nr:DUF2790 domain-containing protein [Pseudomonas chaetocerotis]MBZ9666222.1 DUF2790 domain-containing protein [Pseudomonas chaetocerotis]